MGAKSSLASVPGDIKKYLVVGVGVCERERERERERETPSQPHWS